MWWAKQNWVQVSYRVSVAWAHAGVTLVHMAVCVAWRSWWKASLVVGSRGVRIAPVENGD